MEGGEAKMEKLPPGFRFHPTDEELVTYYLINKISDSNFTERAIGDVDLNKCEPWDLPGKAKMADQREWYFFSLRDRKYPTGVRTNRATNTGYWKTTGKDKEIYNSNTSEQVGMKKTLVFYKGRAPRGEKSNWVMHEYRIHSKSAYRTNKDEWVVCRVFQKSAGSKKYPSNQSRGVNPFTYNLDQMPQNPNVHHTQIENFHFPSRNYMTPAEIQEVLMRVGGSCGGGAGAGSSNGMLNSPAIPQQMINYGVGGGGCFTISGLNLNLGSGGVSASGQPPMRSMQMPPAMPPSGMSNQEMCSSMMNEGYGGDNRFMGAENCGDLENYWPGY